MANILLTGGRAPAALELARCFNAAGHAVFLAESQRGCLSASSSAVRAHFQLPPPRQQTAGFINALQHIMRRQHIDLLVPTCEEVFYVSMGLAQLSHSGKVWVEPIQRLDELHNKNVFIRLAQSVGLPVPETCLINTPLDLDRAFQRWPRLVLKPVYSRFATRTLILPSPGQAKALLSQEKPSSWIAQQYIPGSQICTYSLAHNGHLTAHAAYRSDFTAGMGATIVFRPCHHLPVLNWVRSFVEAVHYSGQISFDFIETAANQVFAIECNPRATSGVHLFNQDTRLPAAFLEPGSPTLFPHDNHPPSMLSAAMLIYALPASIQNKRLKSWFKTICSSRDVIFKWNDPLPALFQVYPLLNYVFLGQRLGISALAASTWDIEWNGENQL